MPTTYPAQQQQQRSRELQGNPNQGIPGQQNQQQPAQNKMLPATGLQQQVMSLQSMRQGLIGQQPGQPENPNVGSALKRPGQTNLNDLAENLARNYGIALGNTPLVDEQGNFLRLPTSGREAVGFQFISQAITDEQNRRQMGKAEGALQTGIGLVQKRGRGSLATMQSGQFENLANLYSSQQTKAADFSYFVQKEQLDRAEDLIRRQEKLAKKKGRNAMIGGILGGVVGAFVGGPMGAAVGYQLGSAAGGGSGYF